ncbi:MAG: sigma-54-dependent Fis family transcriptional regulator, partial [Myxococcales bacterium]|nr:sigma-54-dependent Fis family transcriptional regulator [Myxococcales bacterium]
DLDSTNGTLLDGVPIVEAFVESGAIIRLGATSIRCDRIGEVALSLSAEAKSFGSLLGASVEMRRVYALAERLAKTDLPIIIEGETGTGKEMLAEAIYERSRRARGPYVVFDCTAFAPSLVDSELFGHERGAFTGATSTRRGVFEQADGGTLFIDEIGDLPLELQSKLLRAIERGEVRRLGGESVLEVDVRILAATRRDLDRLVQDGRFRDDLMHRLAVGRIALPPLRRRHGDIERLIHHFWQELEGDPAALSPELVDQWRQDPWFGNVRELRNAVARKIALLEPLEPEDAAPPHEKDDAARLVPELLAARLPLPRAKQALIKQFEQLYIRQVLADHDGDAAAAATASGIARRYFNLLRSGRRR